MNPERTYPFLKAMLQPFHKARRKTVGLVVAAVRHPDDPVDLVTQTLARISRADR